MNVIETARLDLRQLWLDDAPFILELLNDPAFLRFIGDKGVRTLDDARRYLLQGPMAMYAQFGFGLWLTELKADHTPLGICGLIKRPTLANVDIGFAFLPQFRGQGYAYEAAAATLTYGQQALGLTRIVAITQPENQASGRLLEKLGLQFEGLIRLTEKSEEVRLFGLNC